MDKLEKKLEEEAAKRAGENENIKKLTLQLSTKISALAESEPKASGQAEPQSKVAARKKDENFVKMEEFLVEVEAIQKELKRLANSKLNSDDFELKLFELQQSFESGGPRRS